MTQMFTDLQTNMDIPTAGGGPETATHSYLRPSAKSADKSSSSRFRQHGCDVVLASAIQGELDQGIAGGLGVDRIVEALGDLRFGDHVGEAVGTNEELVVGLQPE